MRPEIKDRIMLMNSFNGEIFLPAGTKGTVESIALDTSITMYKRYLYTCTMDDSNCTLIATIGDIEKIPDGNFYLIYDVLERKIYNPYGHFAYTLEEIKQELKDRLQYCGKYTIAVCDQDLQVVQWHCWELNRQESDDNKHYYCVSYTADRVLMPGDFGYFISSDLNDIIPWLHNEKAWKSGQVMAVINVDDYEVYALVPPPPGTPTEGIIAADASAMMEAFKDTDVSVIDVFNGNTL